MRTDFGSAVELRSWSARLKVLRAALSFVLFFVLTTSCFPTESRHRELWRIPDGYQGWIYSRWNAQECKMFPSQGEFLVIDVPPSGIVCTSTPLEEGAARDRFVYVSLEAKETEIPTSRAHTRIFEKGNNDLFVFIGRRRTSAACVQVRRRGTVPRGPHGHAGQRLGELPAGVGRFLLARSGTQTVAHALDVRVVPGAIPATIGSQ